MDTSPTPEERAHLLVTAKTLDEKISLVMGVTANTDGGYVGHILAIPRLDIPELNMKDGPLESATTLLT